jgi:hypothetical protein
VASGGSGGTRRGAALEARLGRSPSDAAQPAGGASGCGEARLGATRAGASCWWRGSAGGPGVGAAACPGGAAQGLAPGARRCGQRAWASAAAAGARQLRPKRPALGDHGPRRRGGRGARGWRGSRRAAGQQRGAGGACVAGGR